MRRNYMVVCLLLFFGVTFAQDETIFKGIVIDAKTQNPLENVVISIQNSAITQLTTRVVFKK
ncbi:hypothetical protein [Flavobacterium aquidurense]|jgi:hypothetical protein|uniref:hypothetical protein n=1 Tax=Flavobacterium aquidurense TaxID=362413 RepID=UPI000924097D|nr:hypothetical protein [Flavobacterium aquidurense]SHH70634.1 hypothetical protein SAMN05444481_12440 [Flavobacterium frigidimaris]